MPAVRKKAKASKPRKLAAKTTPPEPGEKTIWLKPYQTGGMRVTEDTALTIAAFWACVKVITEDLSGLPWHVLERKNGGGATEVPDDPAEWLLHTQANPETSAFQWRETTVAHCLTHGNGFSEIERTLSGRPTWLWQLTPDRVEVVRFNGRIIYDVSNPSGPNTPLEAENVFHLKGLGYDGLVGYSVVEYGARTLGTALAADESASTLFANDSTPGGILKHPGRLSKTARDNLRDSWMRKHAGASNKRMLAILEEGMEWMQTGLPPDQVQLVETRQLTPADICRLLRVSPPKIADLLRATFSNIEELAIWHVGDTLTPWVRRLETEANIKLFGRTNRGKRFTKLNLNALLRGKVAERQAFYTAMMDRGVFSVNEVREKEDMNPIGTDGDKRFVPMNMQLLENAGEEPETPAPPTPAITNDNVNEVDEAEEDDEGDGINSDSDLRVRPQINLSAFLPIIEDACRRALTRVEKAASKAISSGKDMAAWCAEFTTEYRNHLADALMPCMLSIARMIGMAEQLALYALRMHVESRSIKITSESLAENAHEDAKELMKLVLGYPIQENQKEESKELIVKCEPTINFDPHIKVDNHMPSMPPREKSISYDDRGRILGWREECLANGSQN